MITNSYTFKFILICLDLSIGILALKEPGIDIILINQLDRFSETHLLNSDSLINSKEIGICEC